MNDQSRDVGSKQRRETRMRVLRVVSAVFGVLIVVALIVIIMHVHRLHTLRGEIGEGIATADGTRMAVAIYYARNGAWPADNEAAGLLSPSAATGKYVDNVHIENGRIVITLGGQAHPKLRGDHVELTPYLDGALVRWHCSSAGIPKQLIPGNCR